MLPCSLSVTGGIFKLTRLLTKPVCNSCFANSLPGNRLFRYGKPADQFIGQVNFGAELVHP